MVSFFDVSISLRKGFSIEVRRRHGAESLVGGVENRRLSSFPLPLSPGSSWISGRDPLLVVLYCNNPVFTKIKKNLFSVFASLIYRSAIIFPLLSRIGRRPTIATLTLDLCDTGFHPMSQRSSVR